jgi:hypothetical protein
MDGISIKKEDWVFSLKTEYRRLKATDYVSAYSCLWHVKANYNSNTQLCDFSLDRSEVKINNREPEKLMDRIVYEIGSSLYPMRLNISQQMEIVQISNYGEVVDRWKETAEKCRNEHPGEVIDRYIDYSSANISTPLSLKRSLYGDSFFNLYFRNLYLLPEDEEERECVELPNFPEKGMKSAYYCKIQAPSATVRRLDGTLMAILPSQEGVADIDYTLGVHGAPETIAGSFTAVNRSGQYQKKIAVDLLSGHAIDKIQNLQK